MNFIYKAPSAFDHEYKKTNAYKSVHRYIIPLPTDHKEHNIFDILYVLGCVKNVFETVNSVLSIIYLPFILWFESKYCTDLAKALD